MDQIALVIPRPVVLEGDTFTVMAFCRDSATATADTPDTFHFRIDDVTNPTFPVAVQDWTELTPDESIAIALASDYNAIQNACNQTERRQITVVANKDATFQTSARAQWDVRSRGLPV